MTTISKPVIYDEAAIAATTIDADDTNINGAQWSRLLRFAGTGVSSGYVLTLSTVADTATLSTGWGIWNGYTCEITATHTVSLPAVVSAKTYSIGILYDPANLSTPAGPLAVAVYDKASISIPSGGLFWTLYEVDRLPSTVLTASTTRNYRVVPATTIYVASGVALPPPAEYSYGTIAVTPSAVYRRLTSPSPNWALVSDDTGEITSGFIMSSGWTNPGASYQTLGGVTTVHLRATRSGSTISSGAASGSLSDVAVMTLPAAARSRWMETGRGTVTLADGGTQGFDWRISVAGLMTLTSANPSISIAPGSVLYATATFIR